MREAARCLCESSARIYFCLRGFNIFRCTNCSLTFVFPRSIDFGIYNGDYFSGAVHGFGFVNYEEDKTASSGYLKTYLKWLESFGISKGSTLLDIGAANGFFVNMAKEHGYIAAGVELSSEAVEWAKKLGRNVTQSDAMQISVNKKFDVITVLDVLEHLSEPQEFIVKIKENLKPGGILLINVPNIGSIFAKISGKSWHSFVPPEHLFYFNKKSLTELLLRNNYEIVKIKSISKTFKLSYIYKTIIHSPQISVQIRRILKLINPVIDTKLGEIKIYLPLFDNLTIAARITK